MSHYQTITWVLMLSSVGLFLILTLVDAPYGKRDRDGWGPAIPVRWAWFFLELPSFLVPLLVMANRREIPTGAGAVLLLFFMAHYFHRTFVYPLSLRPKPGASFKVIMLITGMPMNGLIGWLMVTMALDEVHLQASSWMATPQFVAGTLIALAGMMVTKQSDAILKALRKPGDNGYYIPTGGMYRWLSCPNYFGELLQWAGFALAAWSLPPLAFLLYTASNLLPRARASHGWYREQFPDYPAQRRAVIPYLL